MIYNIFTAIFNTANDMQLIKEELKIFNKDLKLICLFTQLTSEEVQSQKVHFLVILIFDSDQEVKKSLKK